MWVIEGSNPGDQLKVCRRLIDSRTVEITVQSSKTHTDGTATVYVSSEEILDALMGLFPEMMED